MGKLLPLFPLHPTVCQEERPGLKRVEKCNWLVTQLFSSGGVALRSAFMLILSEH